MTTSIHFAAGGICRVTEMGSRTLVMLKGLSPCPSCFFNLSSKIISSSPNVVFLGNTKCSRSRNFSAKSTGTESSLPPPDVAQLAKTARISLTANEVEEFAPKIRQVVDWFGQLQAVDLDSVEPAIRADIVSENIREDTPEIFENGEAIITSSPSYEEPYIKVPRILNKE